MTINLDKVPFLFPKADVFSNTLFDYFEPWMIPDFTKIMIASDYRGLLYNDIMYMNRERLILLGIDLKCYFESQLFIHQIMNFP